LTDTAPWGVIDPLAPALAAMAKLFRLKAAVAVTLEFIVREQVGENPTHPPDQPAKLEFGSGVAVNVTPVPWLKTALDGTVETEPLPVPVLLTERLNWETPCWVTAISVPAAFRVPVLEVPFGLAATEYPTVPFPLPLPPERIEIQLALLEALQEQPLAAVTPTLPVAPLGLKDWLVVEREYEQEAPV